MWDIMSLLLIFCLKSFLWIQNHVVQNQIEYFFCRWEGAYCTLLETSHLKINILADTKCLFKDDISCPELDIKGLYIKCNTSTCLWNTIAFYMRFQQSAIAPFLYLKRRWNKFCCFLKFLIQINNDSKNIGVFRVFRLLEAWGLTIGFLCSSIPRC